jgi:hypothetical protein
MTTYQRHRSVLFFIFSFLPRFFYDSPFCIYHRRYIFEYVNVFFSRERNTYYVVWLFSIWYFINDKKKEKKYENHFSFLFYIKKNGKINLSNKLFLIYWIWSMLPP